MASGRRAGFTLIEVLAVAAILALLAALVAPNLSGLQQWRLRGEAERLASRLELARQRAIVTGVPHRLWLDLDEAEFRVEWWTGDPTAPEPEPFDALDLAGNAPLPLEAPRAAQIEFRPIPGNFGNLEVVTDPFFVDRLDTPEGPVTAGQAWVLFDRDGTASYTVIHLQDPDGHTLTLDVLPLDELVRIRDADDAV